MMTVHLIRRASLLLAFCAEGLIAAGEKNYAAVDCHRETIYHSPETPGFTCWVYPWIMPDGSIMVSFFQATGREERRFRAPLAIQKALSWPHLSDPQRDMSGLNTCTIYLKSTDNGVTWNKVSEDARQTPMNWFVHGGVSLEKNTIMRSVYGPHLPYDADVPRTGLVQKSFDGGRTWDEFVCPLSPDDFMIDIAGIRRLRDGRIALHGGISRGPAGRPWEEYGADVEPLLLVSSDEGRNWGQSIQVVPDEYRSTWSCEECDMAELPNGDLFWVFRRSMPEDADKPLNQRRHTYWQGVTEKQGDTWKPKWVGPSPFPNLGLPNLLATQEGVILLVNAGQWTDDAGETWHPIINMPERAYYPKGIQLDDGQILVFAHMGSDDPYGVVDQSIIMDSFRLKTP